MYVILCMLIGYHASPRLNNTEDLTQWKLYEDKEIGYSVKYPGDWVAKGAKGGFICGKESGFINAEWTIWISDPKDTERVDFIFNNDGLYDGYDIVEKPITINGVSGIHSTITHKEKPNEYVEFIVIKTKSLWFQIENAGVKDKNFEVFYTSFKLIK